MKNRFINCLVVIFAAFLCGNAAEVVHSVNIVHPGISRQESIPCSLIQRVDDQGGPVEYHMDVDSVVCGDGKCEIIKVRIHWDILGYYQRYELPEGGELTKMGDVPFSRSDYEKLQSILVNPGSTLASYAFEKNNSPSGDSDDQAVDAVTTATPLFYQNTVVSGAVYTCYTLWHWANGDAGRNVRRITEESCSDDLLLQYVKEGAERVGFFAMEQLAERGIYDQKTVDSVITSANSGGPALAEAAAGYFASSLGKKNLDIYFSSMERLFASGDTPKRTLYLRSLSEVEQNGSQEFYDRMARWLPRLKTYFEIHLLLTMLTERAPCSPETVKQALLVLDNKNFLIARRAFWFLQEQNLASAQAQKVKEFQTKYEGRL
ncbi:MAG: hypothetical protein PF904_20900 [Kiritimatiellae bacterium]|jgi:hypothetical protein|nr:hypothetical protein [Kiritimatiellia bacterium]